jgi:hypothetical protein
VVSVVTVTSTAVARSPLIGPLAVVAIIVVAVAGTWIYGVIRKGL